MIRNSTRHRIRAVLLSLLTITSVVAGAAAFSGTVAADDEAILEFTATNETGTNVSIELVADRELDSFEVNVTNVTSGGQVDTLSEIDFENATDGNETYTHTIDVGTNGNYWVNLTSVDGNETSLAVLVTVGSVEGDDDDGTLVLDFDATNPSGTSVTTNVTASGELDSFEVNVTNETSGEVVVHLTETDFTNQTEGDGNETYTNTTDVNSNGTYEVNLTSVNGDGFSWPVFVQVGSIEDGSDDGSDDPGNGTVLAAGIAEVNGTEPSDLDDISLDAFYAGGLLQVQLVNDTASEGAVESRYELAGLGVDEATEFQLEIQVENDTPRLLLGSGNVSEWAVAENGDGTTNVSIWVSPVEVHSIFDCEEYGDGCVPDIADWPEGENDTATESQNATVQLAVESLDFADPDDANVLNGTILATDAQAFGSPSYTPASGGQPPELSLFVAGPHNTTDGEENEGFYNALLPKALLDDWGIEDPQSNLTAAFDGDSADFTVKETGDGDARIEVDLHYSSGAVSISAEPTTDAIIVDDDGSGEFDTIQAAIDAADDGDTIEVAAGTYQEDVTIDKPVSLLAEGDVEVHGQGSTHGTFYISSLETSTSNVLIDGFTVYQNSSGQALNFETGEPVDGPNENITVRNSTFVASDEGFAVFAANVKNVEFRNNTFSVEDGSSAIEVVYIGGERSYGAERASTKVDFFDNVFEGNASRSGENPAGALEHEANDSQISGNDFSGVTPEAGVLVETFGENVTLDGNEGYAVAGSTNLYTEIGAAIEHANAGETLNVAPGNYVEPELDVDKPLTLAGAGSGYVTIDRTQSETTGRGIDVQADDVTLSGFTLLGPNGSSGSPYGLKLGPTNLPSDQTENIHVEDVVVEGSTRTAIDLHGVNGGLLIDVRAANATSGNGIAFTDTKNVHVDGAVVTGNAWGGIAYYTNTYMTEKGTDNVTVSDTVIKDHDGPGAYAQNTGGADDPFSYLVIESTTFENNTIQVAELNGSNTVRAQSEWLDFGAIRDDSGNQFDRSVAVSGFAPAAILSSVQDAVDGASDGDTIEVANGTYDVGRLQIPTNKNGLTIQAAGSDRPVIEGDGGTNQRILDVRGDGTTIRGIEVRSTGVGEDVAFYVFGRDVTVKDNVITNILTGIQTGQHEDGNATIVGNYISDVGVGISLQNNNNTVEENTVEAATIGALGVGHGSRTVDTNTISRNRFTGSGGAPGASAHFDAVVDVTENWWGDESGPTHASNPDGSGAAVELAATATENATITFDPWYVNENMDTLSNEQDDSGSSGGGSPDDDDADESGDTVTSSGSARTEVTSVGREVSITVEDAQPGDSVSVQRNDQEVTEEVERHGSALEGIETTFDQPADFEMTVTSSTGKPDANIPDPPSDRGTVGYVNVEHSTNDDAVGEVRFNFRVTADRLEQQGIGQDEVVIYRYSDDGEWTALETEFAGTNADGTLRFTAVSPGLSVFAIGGPQAQQETPDQPPEPTEQPPDDDAGTPAPDMDATPEPGAEDPVEEPAGFSLSAILVALALAALVVGLFVLARRRY